MADPVLYQAEGPVATLTINRPEKRNALNGAVVEGLLHGLNRAEADGAIRVVVLTGAGSVFSAGADLDALQKLQSATAEENLADSARLAVLFKRIYQLEKPVIARVNGHAIAGGCGLAAVCDFSIASAEAKFGFTEVRIGFVPAIVGVFLLRKVGETRLRDMLLRGALLSAEEAVAAGLITMSAAPADLDQAVAGRAAELARETSATALVLTKRLLAAVPGMGLDEAIDYAVQMNTLARGTSDCRAGVAAFLDRKDPPWRKSAH